MASAGVVGRTLLSVPCSRPLRDPIFGSMWDCAMLIGAPQWNSMTSMYVSFLLSLNVLMQR